MSEDDLLAGLLEEEEEQEEESKPESKQIVVTTSTAPNELPVELPVEERKPQARVEVKTEIVPAPAPKAKSQVNMPVEIPEPVEEILEVEEEEPPHKLVILIVGDKGTGKTVTALSFPGEICVLSFDRKAMPIKSFFYKGDKRIHVFDIVKYVDWRPERITETAAKAFDAIERVLEKCAKMKADWIVFDGTEIMEQLAEMYMRHRHGLGPIEGIRNLNIWKERRWILRAVHNRALSTARKGVIYTVYPTWSERIVAGEVVDRKQEPKWLEFILFETDIVLWTRYDENMKRFLVEVQTSKLDKLMPTGHVYDVTGNPLGSQIDWKQVWNK